MTAPMFAETPDLTTRVGFNPFDDSKKQEPGFHRRAALTAAFDARAAALAAEALNTVQLAHQPAPVILTQPADNFSISAGAGGGGGGGSGGRLGGVISNIPTSSATSTRLTRSTSESFECLFKAFAALATLGAIGIPIGAVKRSPPIVVAAIVAIFVGVIGAVVASDD